MMVCHSYFSEELSSFFEICFWCFVSISYRLFSSKDLFWSFTFLETFLRWLVVLACLFLSIVPKQLIGLHVPELDLLTSENHCGDWLLFKSFLWCSAICKCDLFRCGYLFVVLNIYCSSVMLCFRYFYKILSQYLIQQCLSPFSPLRIVSRHSIIICNALLTSYFPCLCFALLCFALGIFLMSIFHFSILF